jgi:hypothetical protein
MKRILAVLAIVLLTASVASAGHRRYVVASPVVYGPTPVVVNYWPAAPVYTYPAPYVVSRPVVYGPAPVVYRPAPVIYTGPVVYGPPFMRGQPVRNVLRATFW